MQLKSLSQEALASLASVRSFRLLPLSRANLTSISRSQGHEKAPIEKLVHELTLARNILKTPPTEPLPVGVGFIGWILDKSESLSKDLFPLLFEHRVKAIWLSFGDKLGHYVQYIRELSQQTGHNILVFILVSSLGEAQRAINEWKADVIVAQGSFNTFIPKKAHKTSLPKPSECTV